MLLLLLAGGSVMSRALQAANATNLAVATVEQNSGLLGQPAADEPTLRRAAQASLYQSRCQLRMGVSFHHHYSFKLFRLLAAL